jgi:hypothetical protein
MSIRSRITILKSPIAGQDDQTLQVDFQRLRKIRRLNHLNYPWEGAMHHCWLLFTLSLIGVLWHREGAD